MWGSLLGTGNRETVTGQRERRVPRLFWYRPLVFMITGTLQVATIYVTSLIITIIIINISERGNPPAAGGSKFGPDSAATAGRPLKVC